MVVFAMSIFSALATTMLTDKELESRMRAKVDDLHLVLYAAAIQPSEFLARLNVPTISRLRADEQREPGAEVRIPLPTDLESLADRWIYHVELSPGVSVCCDGGDQSCENVGAFTPVPGSLNRPLTRVEPASRSEKRLAFALATQSLADSTEEQIPPPEAGGFLVRATNIDVSRVASPIQSGPSGADDLSETSMSCTLRANDEVVASGLLRLRQAGSRTSPGSESQPVFEGTLDLKYRK
jgi:hypothetical protein